MDEDLPEEDAPRSVAARIGAGFGASPVELAGLSVLLLGALLVTALVVLDAWRRPSAPSSAAAVGEPIDAWPGGPGSDDGGHDVHGGHGPAAGSDTGETDTAVDDAEVVVHVSGAVHEPGVVTLPSGSRVADAISSAGGARADGETDRLNLARVLADGEQVHVPVEGEEAVAPTEPTQSGVDAEGVVDLNQATQEQLESLPGIGPAKASAIVEHRESNGPFQAPGDIRAVPGIGEATFQQLAERITVR